MALTNSQPNNINVPNGNGLVVYIDGETNQVYVRDVRGATEELNVLTESITTIIAEGGLTALKEGSVVTMGTDSSIIQLKVEKGEPNGYASLDANGKLPVSQLPVSVLTYEGMWNAATNTPTLADGTGNAGDFYIVSVAGTQNLGSGPISFEVGDWVIYNGSIWQRNSSNLPDLQEVTDVGATTTNAINTAGITTDYVQLDTTATPTLTVGMARWNASQLTWEVGIGTGPTAYEMGQSLFYPQVRNTSGTNLPKGTLVMVDPTDVVTGDRLNVVRAVANGTYISQLIVGVLGTAISSNQTGTAIWFGQIYNASNSAINLGGETWSDGQILYADPANPGGLTNVEPTAPNLKVIVAAITSINGGNVSLIVRPWLNEKINQLSDVAITSPVDNSILQFNSTTGVWEDVAGTTTNIAEGTNLYFTTARARESVSAGDGISYDSGTGVITNSDKGSSQDIFKNIAVATQSTITADTNNDTLTLAAGTNIGITTNATTDTITFSTINVPTGTGVANYVALWTSSSNLSTSLIYDTGAAIGIGTSAPTSILQVGSTANQIFNLDFNTANTIKLAGQTPTLWLEATPTNPAQSTAVILRANSTAGTIQMYAGTKSAQFNEQGTFSINAIGGPIGTNLYVNGPTLIGNSSGSTPAYLEINAYVAGVAPILTLRNRNDGAAGRGSKITFYNGFGTIAEKANLSVTSIDGTGDGFNMSFGTTATGGTIATQMQLLGSGTLVLNSYGTGAKTGTAAYNLLVDASGNLIEGAGGVIDGSGTTNYVAKFTDSNSIGDSQIFDNGTNVGIGTATPSQLLHVAGAARITGSLYDSTNDPGSVTEFLSSTGSGTAWATAVTSVAFTVPTGFAIANSPITTSGTLGLTFAAGYSLPTDARQTEWDTAYNDSITAFAYNTGNGVLTLTQRDLGTLTATVTLQPFTTTNLAEGTNLYYTDARVRLALSAGTGISYDNTTGVITNSDRGSSQFIFKNLVVAGQDTIVADTNDDTLTIVAGTNVSITTNASTDTITINSTDQFVGTVTSVAMSVPTGFSIAGSPITTSGTLGLSFSAGYSLPTNASQTEWDTSYDRSLTNFGYNTTTGILTLTKQDAATLTATITLQPFTTTNLAEGTNLYYTDARARLALSAGTGISYDNTTGVITNSDQGSSQFIFKNVAVTGSELIVADSNDDTITFTAGSGVTLSSSAATDTITISATGLGGTVTSVSLTAPTGFTVSGSPITTSGTLSIGFDTGYSLPTTAKQTNWDDAYDNKITASSFSTSTGTLTLTQQDTGTLTTNFDGRYILLSEKAAANGVATLDGSGKIPSSQLPSSVFEYKGLWNAATNTPTLADGTGDPGDVYQCSVAGTVNFGSGPVTFAVGDLVIYDGTEWQKSDSTSEVLSVNGQVGVVVLTTTDIGEGTNLYYTDARARLAISGGTGITYNNTAGTITNADPGSSQAIFKNIEVAGQSTVTAEINNDTLTLVAGTNVSITTNATTDTITINSTDQFAGTVTSVAMSVPTGFTISGSPITSAGTLGLAFASGYSLPTDSVQANWTTAYNRSLTAFAYNTSTAVLTLTEQDSSTLTATITLQPFTTSNLAEGTNLYYTDARARGALEAGTGISYNSTTGTITNSDRGSSQSIFKNIAVSGESTIVADGNDDTLTIVAGTNVSITTNASTDTITINSTDQYAGTVTSVAMSVPTGFTISGSPITSAGTLGLAFASGYSLPTDSVQANWTTAYNRSLTAFAYNTSTGVLTLTEQDASTLTATITLQPFTTTNLAEGTNLYFTDGRARGAISLTTTGTSGAATYNSTTGVLNIPQYQSAITNPVTGTGTTNYVAKWSSSSAITDSLIFDNGTNVGISNATPGEKLDITGNARVSSYYLFSGNPGNPGGSTASIYDQAGVGPTISGLNVAFRTGSTPAETMRIASDGSVGIGTASPASILHVSTSGANAYSTTITKGSNMKGIVNTLSNNANDMVGIYFATGVDASGNHWSGITGSRSNAPTDWGTQLNFYTHDENTSNIDDATQKMVIKGSGSVGIGTSSPAEKLHVESTGDVNILVRTSGASGNAYTTYENSGDNTFAWAIGRHNAGGFYFSSSTGGTYPSGTTTTRMVIDTSGNVGIGTTVPLSKFDVSLESGQALFIANESGTISDGDLLGAVSFGSRDGSTYSSGGITNIRSYATATYNTGNVSGDMRFYVSNSLQNTTQAALFGTEAMRITAGGNVLIGTTTDAGFKLTVSGNATVISGNSSLSILANDTWATNFLKTDMSASAVAHIFGKANSTNNSATLRYYHVADANASNYIGLGFYGNDDLLRVFVNAGVRLTGYGSGTITGTPTFNLAVDASGNIIETAGGVVDGSGTANYVTKWQDANTVTNSIIRDDGTTVGIGTAPAAAKLTVDGSITAGGQTNYGKSYGSIDTTGEAVAGLIASTNGQGSMFTFTCRGGNGEYQRVVYSCYNDGGTWYTNKVIDEGTNALDVTASANGATITFTFKARSTTQAYTPAVLVQQFGSAIDTSYL